LNTYLNENKKIYENYFTDNSKLKYNVINRPVMQYNQLFELVETGTFTTELSTNLHILNLNEYSFEVCKKAYVAAGKIASSDEIKREKYLNATF
jgi:hypothetical protein